MRLTFLGTATSTGIPALGCTCPTCTSNDPRDKRLRCSAMIESGDTAILIDCGPDFRQQMLRLGWQRPIDAVFFTHQHFDHVGGVDDLRPYSYRQRIPLYANAVTRTHLENCLPYCLKINEYPGVPQLTITTIQPHDVIQVKDLQVLALDVMHGNLPILGYRIGDLAYITDMTTMNDSEMKLLEGVKILVVNALRHRPHRTHQTVEDAINFSERLGCPETYLIHMSHDLAPIAQEEGKLPSHVHFAYDGLVINLQE